MSFKSINYRRLLFTFLSRYFSIRDDNTVSYFYKFLACFVQPIEKAFNGYDTFRQLEYLISVCKWQMANTANLLNYIYDPTLKRIYLSQSVETQIYAEDFPYDAITFFNDWSANATLFLQDFNSPASYTPVKVNVPSVLSAKLPDMTATINQIKFDDTSYTINTF